MAVNVGVNLNPNTKKVEAALARIQAQAKGIDFGGGARSIEKLSRPLGKITGQASEFQKSLEASNARVLAFGASVAVINKLSQAFGALVTNTIKVEATFAKINTILGGTQKQLEQFGNGIFRVAQNTATSFDQVAEGALELARQGLSVEESLSRVETALKLVRVAGIDSQTAVEGLTAAIKGFEGAGLTVANIADKLAEVDTKFAVSTEDLINGLERASASARVAGVSFDELLAVVTTVQERTQRGGAVIGNAFKTIFARLGRTDTLVALEELGINVLDAQGNVRSAVPLFQELAVELEKLGLKSVEAGEIIQKVAGVRQRDILISLVEDLNSSQSQFAKSLQVSAGAAGALDSKNKQLNDTLEALINNLTTGSQKLSSVIGELGFSDAAKDILKVFNAVVNGITDLLQGDSIGAKFAQGLVKGIGSILTGPGLALISAIFVKLFVDLAKFGATSLKSLLGINKAAEAQRTLQQSVLQTLLQNEAIQKEILALEGNKVAQEQLLLRIYNQQAAALARVQKAAATVTPGLFGRGFRGGEGGINRRAASGYVAAEARDVSRGVGGAPANSKVVSIPNFAFGGGKRGTMVANTSEYFVPNYAGGGDAIFNRDMVKSVGLPAGARKINAADGYVPNFVRPRSLERLRGLAKGGGPEAKAAKAELAKRQKAKSQQKLIYNPRFAMIVPQVIGPKQRIQGSRKGKKVAFDLVGFEPGVGSRVRNDEQLDASVKKYALGLANAEAKKLGAPPRPEKVAKLANTGAISALSGTIFETAVSSLLNSKDFDARSEIAAFDFAGSGANKKLKKLFPQLGRATEIEAKIRPSKANKQSMFDKILKATGNAALGYIPNFADGALDEAVAREQAAGVPINQIRINQSGKLRNAQNPQGLAVTNTRDEPTGKIPNFAKTGAEGFSSGLDASITKLFALQLAVGGLTSVIGSTEEGASNLQKSFAILGSATMTAVNAMLVMSTVGINPFGKTAIPKGVTQGVGKAIAGFGRLAKFIGPLAKGLFAVSRFIGPISIGILALSTALKLFTGKGILGQFGIGVENSTDALKKFRDELEGGSSEEKKKARDEAQKNVGRLEGNKEFFQGIIDAVPRTARRGFSRSLTRQEKFAQKSLREIDLQLPQAQQRLAITEEAFSKTGAGIAAGIAAGESNRKFQTSKGASEFLREEGPLERGRFAVQGVGETGVTGNRKKILEEELALAKAQGTEEEFNIEKRINGLKFEIEAGKQRFQITDDFTNKLKEGGSLQTAALDVIADQVEKGGDLNDIQDALKDKGIILRDNNQKILNKELERLRVLNLSLQAQEDEIDNENDLIDLKKEKFAEEQRLAGLLERRRSESALASITRDVSLRGLDTQTKQGPISSATIRSIGFQKEFIQLEQELADLNDDKLNAAAKLESLQKEESGATKQQLKEAKNLVKETEKRYNELKPIIQAEKKIAEFRVQQSGFDLGMENLRSEILSFEDKLGQQIPSLFSSNLSQAMKDAISGAKDLEDALLGAAASFTQTLADAFIDQAAKQATASILGGGQGLNVLGAATQAAGSAAGGAASATSGGGKGGIGGFISGLFGGGKKAAAPGTTATNPLFVQDVGALSGGETGGIAEAVKEGLSGEGESKKGFFSGLTEKLGGFFDGFKDKMGGLFDGIKGLFTGKSGGSGGGLGGIFSSVIGAFTGGNSFGLGSLFSFFNQGGSVGRGTDTVPAMLTPGEFVVRKEAVDKYGTSFLSSLNKGVLPMQGFQNGGSITPVTSEIGGNTSNSSVTNNSQFSFNIENGTAEQTGGEGQSQDQRQFAERVREAVTTVIHEESRTGGSLNYLR